MSATRATTETRDNIIMPIDKMCQPQRQQQQQQPQGVEEGKRELYATTSFLLAKSA